jgi:hypothetical protein
VLHVLHAGVGLEVAVDPEAQNPVAPVARTELANAVEEAEEAEESQKGVPEPQDQENLRLNLN